MKADKVTVKFTWEMGMRLFFDNPIWRQNLACKKRGLHFTSTLETLESFERDWRFNSLYWWGSTGKNGALQYARSYITYKCKIRIHESSKILEMICVWGMYVYTYLLINVTKRDCQNFWMPLCKNLRRCSFWLNSGQEYSIFLLINQGMSILYFYWSIKALLTFGSIVK